MEIREMAEAHLKNVQQQIQELQANRDRIDADLRALNDYLQQGINQLNESNQAPPDFQPTAVPVEKLSEGGVSIPSLTLPGSQP